MPVPRILTDPPETEDVRPGHRRFSRRLRVVQEAPLVHLEALVRPGDALPRAQDPETEQGQAETQQRTRQDAVARGVGVGDVGGRRRDAAGQQQPAQEREPDALQPASAGVDPMGPDVLAQLTVRGARWVRSAGVAHRRQSLNLGRVCLAAARRSGPPIRTAPPWRPRAGSGDWSGRARTAMTKTATTLTTQARLRNRSPSAANRRRSTKQAAVQLASATMWPTSCSAPCQLSCGAPAGAPSGKPAPGSAVKMPADDQAGSRGRR